MTTPAHAKYNPSSAHRWMVCPGSMALETLAPRAEEKPSEYAAEGTAAHELAAWVLTKDAPAAAYIGHQIQADGFTFTVDREMADNVQAYADRVRDYAEDGELLVEQRMEFSEYVDHPEQFGTSDAVVLTSDGLEIQVHDLKYGQGVKVDAQDNQQAMLYALGALAEFGMVGDFLRVRVVIHQPRLNHVSEADYTIQELMEFAKKAKQGVERCEDAIHYLEGIGNLRADYFNPGEDQCRFCPAKATCPALRKEVLAAVSDDFIDETQPLAPQLEPALERTMDNRLLGNLLGAVDLIEGFCKAIRAAAEVELLAGREVPGWKLVEGRRGSRRWGSEQEAEDMLKSMRLKVEDMYDLKLISPTTAEKLHKAGAIGPRQWPRLQELITQAEGKPSVAPADDKRPALVMTAVEDDFDDETTA